MRAVSTGTGNTAVESPLRQYWTMATWKRLLADPPPPGRARDLWIQHAAGYILFDDVRGYAMEQLADSLTDRERSVAQEAVDHALYGLMQVIDGVTGGLKNDEWAVDLRVIVQLHQRNLVAEAVDLVENGDGMCMGYHRWMEGDFGVDPVVQS